MLKYYKPSGKASPLAFAYFLLSTFFIFSLLGILYAYAIWYVPFIYIKVLFTAALGYGVGFVVKKIILEQGRVRSKTIAIILATLSALVALYFSWIVWTDLIFNEEAYVEDGFALVGVDILEMFNNFFKPFELFSIIRSINSLGVWELFGIPFNGIMLSAVWLIELLLVVVIANYISIDQANEPFCEENGKWFEQKTVGPFNFINPQSYIKAFEEGNTEGIQSITKQLDTNANHSIFKLYANETNENYLSVVNRVSKIEDGKISFDDTYVIKNLAISESLSNYFESL